LFLEYRSHSKYYPNNYKNEHITNHSTGRLPLPQAPGADAGEFNR